jgi:Ca2+-binding EF-hand superfamily protein
MFKFLSASVLCFVTAAAIAAPPQFGGNVGGAVPQRGADERNAAKRSLVPEQPAARKGELAGGNAEVIGVPAVAGAPGAAAAPVNRMFAVIDANSDGVINANELRRAVAALKTLDADRDGNISLAEVSSPGTEPGNAFLPGNANQPVDQTMAQFDKNKDGKLTADEVPGEMAMMLRQADQNGDGAIARAELAAAMERMQGMFNGAGGPGNRGGGNMDQFSQQMTELLRSYDRNRDGRLTPDELPPQMQGALQGADQNGDGAIDPRELEIFRRQFGARVGRGPNGEPMFGPDGRGPGRGPRGGN